jgi:hypothetical protein
LQQRLSVSNGGKDRHLVTDAYFAEFFTKAPTLIHGTPCVWIGMVERRRIAQQSIAENQKQC